MRFHRQKSCHLQRDKTNEYPPILSHVNLKKKIQKKTLNLYGNHPVLGVAINTTTGKYADHTMKSIANLSRNNIFANDIKISVHKKFS